VTPGAAQTTTRKKFLLSGADHDSSRRSYAESEINNPEDDSTLKSRLVKLALTVGSVLTALLAGAANLKIT
jgi:hypothetical protein